MSSDGGEAPCKTWVFLIFISYHRTSPTQPETVRFLQYNVKMFCLSSLSCPKAKNLLCSFGTCPEIALDKFRGTLPRRPQGQFFGVFQFFREFFVLMKTQVLYGNRHLSQKKTLWDILPRDKQTMFTLQQFIKLY